MFPPLHLPGPQPNFDVFPINSGGGGVTRNNNNMIGDIPPEPELPPTQVTTDDRPQTTMPAATGRRQRTASAMAAMMLASPGIALTQNQQWWRMATPLRKRMIWSFTVLVILILSVVLIVSLGAGSIVSTRINPTLGPSSCILLRMGAKYSPLIVRQGQVWRLLTAIFVSSGFFTYFVYVLLTIMLMLPMEIAFGVLPVAVTFLLSGFLSNIFSAASSIEIDCGAGGALMGIIGFRVACIILCWSDIEMNERRRIGMLEIASGVLLIITGISPNVDNSAHFAGLVCGSFAGSVFFSNKLDATPTARLVTRVMAFCGLMFVGGIWISLIASGGFPLIDDVIMSTICPPGEADISRVSSWGMDLQLPPSPSG